MVDTIRSLEPLLQHIPIPHHAAADCSCQVALAVQVTYEGTNEGIREHAGNRRALRMTALKAGSHRDQQQRVHCCTPLGGSLWFVLPLATQALSHPHKHLLKSRILEENLTPPTTYNPQTPKQSSSAKIDVSDSYSCSLHTGKGGLLSTAAQSMEEQRSTAVPTQKGTMSLVPRVTELRYTGSMKCDSSAPCKPSTFQRKILSLQDMVRNLSPCWIPSHVGTMSLDSTGMVPSPV